MVRWLGTEIPEERIIRRSRDVRKLIGRRVRRNRRRLIVALLLLGVGIAETRTSFLQSLLFTQMADRMHFHVEAGASKSIVFPAHGPFDERLGYTRLPDYVAALSTKGFVVERQAQSSSTLMLFQRMGGFAPYKEKTSTGLTLQDAQGEPIFAYRQPGNIYASFDEVPDLVRQSLLFVENRELLDFSHPRRNPAVEWDRLGLALITFGRRSEGRSSPGGSTVATQMEKLRHSPQGRTTGAVEKLRQMTSASLRAYQDGADTVAFRKSAIVDALNLMPLAGFRGHGEIIGLGDGLALWYGADFPKVNRVLTAPARTDAELRAKGLALKQVLSLVIAQRRPAWFLGTGRNELERLTEGYLRLMAADGRIDRALADAAVAARLAFNTKPPATGILPPETAKAANSLRLDLARMLGGSSFYDLHRLDLRAETTIDADAQARATKVLRSLKDPQQVGALGLTGPRLLSGVEPARVNYSFTLYERGPAANYLRIRTDSLDGPLDVNAGTKLELGSTAKVRTLITYLEIIADLYEAHRRAPVARLEKIEAEGDPLSAWVAGELRARGDKGLPALLDAAMQKQYSAGTGERFFTAGGMHVFANFDRRHGGKMTVAHGLQQSVNLVFIRMMRDIVDYQIARIPGAKGVLENPSHPARQVYLRRFIDMEGRQFLARYLPEYRELDRAGILKHVAERAKFLRPRLAAAYRTVLPDADYRAFSAFIRKWATTPPEDEEAMRKLYETYAPDRLNLADRSYIAGIHPLELWLAGYLYRHPGASWNDIVTAGADVRQESYRWLLKPNRLAGQNRRIRTMLERQAFVPIHKDWQRLGYPFGALIPSYATAIGTSGDRPDALAQLMGIIASGGYHYPQVSIERLHFAEGTPYETVLRAQPAKGERVLRPEIAAVMHKALVDVVENGTARRAFEAVAGADGKPMVIGGKTGTGDNRGGVAKSVTRSRTATFVFFIGDRYFGTMTAYVEGAEAARYHFTSALPAQLFKQLAPVTESVINRDRKKLGQWPKASIQALPAKALNDHAKAFTLTQPANEPGCRFGRDQLYAAFGLKAQRLTVTSVEPRNNACAAVRAPSMPMVWPRAAPARSVQ